MTLSLRYAIIIAVAAFAGFVAGSSVMSVLNQLAEGVTHGTGGGGPEIEFKAGLVLGGLAALAAGLLGGWLGANKGTPRINIFLALGVVGALAMVPAAVRFGVESRATATRNRIASDDIRARGMTAFAVADRLTRAPGGVDALAGVVRDEAASPEARLTAGLALVESQSSPSDVHGIVDTLVRTPGPLRLTAMAHFGELSTPVDYPGGRVGRWVGDALQDPDTTVQFAALKALARKSWDREAHREPCETLGELARDPDPQVRVDTLAVLGVCAPAAIVERIKAALEDADPGVRREAVHNLSRLGETPADRAARVGILVSSLRDADASVRVAAEQQLAVLPLSSPIPEERAYRLSVLKALLTGADRHLRRVAAEEIGTLANRQLPRHEVETGIALLTATLQDADPEVRAAAIKQLVVLRREAAAFTAGVRP